MFAFQSLEIYKKAKSLAVDTYSMTRLLPDFERYCLVSQMNRAAISVPSNIAEGYGRGTVKDKIYFLNIAKASLYELICQCEIAYELNYIDGDKYKHFEQLCNDLSIRINNYKKYIAGNYQ